MTTRASWLAALSLAAACAGAARSSPTAHFDSVTYSGRNPVNALLKAGPGDYRNPILAGFYPDPSLVRVGRDYYLVNSSFTYFPGLPIFHSRDLVTWVQVANALNRPDEAAFRGLDTSLGLFAPDISFHDGLFYIVNTCVGCGGNFLITARDPKGPWSDPVWLKGAEGIDPSLYVDDDGQAYLIHTGSPPGPPAYEGHGAIWLQTIDLKAKRVTGAPKLLVDKGTHPERHPRYIEGPHIFKRHGWYYLMAAEGGTEAGHSEVIFRSHSVLGPYQAYDGNPILTQRDLPADRPHAVTSVGHADLVETQTGEWWAVFLGAQPYEDDLYNTGRQTFLAQVTWKDDWPTILPPGAPVPMVAPRPKLPKDPPARRPMGGDFSVTETFKGGRLGLEWVTMRNPSRTWWRLEPKGGLSLEARPVPIGSLQDASFLARRQQHMDATVSTRVRFRPSHDGDRAGLAAVQNENVFFVLALGQDRGRAVVSLERRAGAKDPVTGVMVAEAPVPAGRPIGLKIVARGGRYDFAYALRPGQWTTLAADQDGTILATRKAEGFVGVTIGPYAYSPGT